MKIAFCSAVSFGAQGSPGTYKFIEKCGEYFDIIVLAPLSGQRTVFSSSTIPIIPIKNLHSKEYIEDMINYLRYFNPDIIYIFNFPQWSKLFLSFKKYFPNKKYILDIKSPLLADGQKRKEIKQNGISAHVHLDVIVTLSEHNVPTWIPNCTIEPLVYPLGVDLCLFKKSPSTINRKNCLRFVYIGVLHAKRQLEQLIEIFQIFATKTKKKVFLDFYGTGADYERLQKLASSLPMESCIKFYGLYPQKELIHILSTYDAGIAWVPYDEYNTSPSLKAIEYMAAGIPILASDTKAHRLLENDGCSIEFFSNTPSSLLNALLKMYHNGFSDERIQQNLKAVQKYDYNRIIQDFFHPLFEKLAKKKLNERNKNTLKKSQRILYIGPLGFRPGVWETRSSYIFPDLFEAVPKQFEIHMLTGRVPEFARKTLEELCSRYDITHFEAHPKPKNTTSYGYWEKEISFMANQIRPDVITNIFAPVTLGTAMGLVGKKIGARIILRVAGDEIGSRLPMGLYDKHLENLDADMANQTLGIQMADTIIVMSPLEKERICKDLPKSQWNRVLVCIRGIDVSRFPKVEKNYLSERVERFLYVGRKSLEKGYDILKDVADITFNANKHIQFAFAGSFEPLKIKNRDYIGWVDNNNLQKIFSESDAFIMTSRTEGFPQVVAEALATGLPCILPKHIFKSIFKNNQEALLTSLDPKEISKVILKLHEDKKLAASLSDEARKFAETKLDKKIWSKIYHNILLGKEKSISDPFSLIKTEKRGKGGIISDKVNKAQLKIVLLVSPAMLSIGNARHKLNRLIIEMVKRKHLLFLVFPNNEPLSFNTSEDVIFLPYRSLQTVKKQIQKLTPDLLIMAANNQDRLKYYSLAYGTDIPLVILELLYSNAQDSKEKYYQPTFDTAFAAWEEELFLSSAVLILTLQKKNTYYLSKIIHQRVAPYPKIVFQKNKSREGELETKYEKNIPVSFPINNLTLQHWDDLNNKMFDRIEIALLEAAGYKNDPKRLLREQMDIAPEHALHARRMRDKLLQQYKG